MTRRRSTWLWWWLLISSVSGAAVSPPRWADPQRNPCAALPGGWQLLQWPPDGLCYRIFTVGPPGPCPPTQELAPDALSGAATCRCPPGTARLHNASTSHQEQHEHCHPLYKRGPCAPGHYFAPLPQDQEGRRLGACAPLGRCDGEGEIFWPATRRCYAAMTRGPCPRGELLLPPQRRSTTTTTRPNDDENDTDPSAQQQILQMESDMEESSANGDQDGGRDDGLPRCACTPHGALASHYWASAVGGGGGGGDAAGGVGGGDGGGGACYEHFTRGPCLEDGHLFLPGGVCGCQESLPHFHNETRRCYQLGSAGPCAAGHRFVAAPGEAHARCRCKEGHVPWTGGGGGGAQDNSCYRLYTRGPCPEGQFLLDMATCATLCQRGRLYFPEHNICYRVGLRGPCPRGHIVLFEDSVRPSLDGISYRGMCGCPNGARHCSPSPSASSSYRDSSTSLCDAKAGVVRWGDGSCHALYSRGPCPQNQWLVPQREGRLLWDEGGWRRKNSAARCDCRPGYKALLADGGVLSCQPPAVSLAKFLNHKYNNDDDTGPDQQQQQHWSHS